MITIGLLLTYCCTAAYLAGITSDVSKKQSLSVKERMKAKFWSGVLYSSIAFTPLGAFINMMFN